MSDIKPKPIHWLWNPYIALGKLIVLAGNPGVGKSQVSSSLIAMTTNGGPWPTSSGKTESKSAIILNAEDDAEDTIRPRLEAAGADLDRVFIVDAIKHVNEDGSIGDRAFNIKKDIYNLEVQLGQIGDVGLIVIDPVTAYLGNTDSHKNAEVRAVLMPLAEMASACRISIVMVTHLNKSNRNDALMRITGSLAFAAAARGAFLVAPDQQESDRRLFLPVKNNIGEDKAGLSFRIEQVDLPGDITTTRVVWDDEPVTISANDALFATTDPEERGALDNAKAFLLEILNEGPLQAKRIFAHALDAGHSDKTIRRAKGALKVVSRKRKSDGKWEWHLPGKDGQADPV